MSKDSALFSPCLDLMTKNGDFSCRSLTCSSNSICHRARKGETMPTEAKLHLLSGGYLSRNKDVLAKVHHACSSRTYVHCQVKKTALLEVLFHEFLFNFLASPPSGGGIWPSCICWSNSRQLQLHAGQVPPLTLPANPSSMECEAQPECHS